MILKRTWSLIKNFRWQSLFFKYWVFSLAIFIIPLSIFITTFYFFYYKTFNLEIKNAVSQSFVKSSLSVEKTFDEIDKNYNIFSSNNYVSILLNKSIDSIYGLEISQNSVNVHELMQNTINASGSLESIYIYSKLNNYVISSKSSNYLDDFYNKEWLDYYNSKSNSKYVFISNLNYKTKLLSVLYSFGEYQNSYSDDCFVFNIDLEEFEKTLFAGNSIYNDTFYLADGKGRVIYSNNQNLIGTNMEMYVDLKTVFEHDYQGNPYAVNSNKNNITCFSKLNNQDLYFISITQLSYLKNNFNALSKNIIFVIIISIIITGLLSFFVSVHFYNSIAEITTRIDSTYDDSNSNNELNYVINNVISLTERNKKIEDELITKMSNLRKSQSVALQTQINPHFLFNTLNLVNIIVMRITKSDNDATKVVSLLSDILHCSMDTQNYMVNVGVEIEHAKKFIEIESIKNQNSFDVFYDIDENVLNCSTVKLILQPIIENSIEHGFKLLKGRKPTLNISVEKRNDNLVYSVTDNGTGFSHNDLAEINEKLEQNSIPESKHIGLCNVNQRIKLIFGEAYGIKISSDSEKTTVEISMPITYI